MQERRDEPSLGELFADLARNTTTLVRQEVELAKTEMSQKAARVGKDVAFLAIGGAVLYAGFLTLLAALIIGLGQLGLPWWLSALLVGLVVAAVGGFLIQQGLTALRRENLAPQQTIATLKEDAEWAKEQTS
jgi:hypothetical protein